MTNQEIADLFYEIADILEFKEIKWKPRAYRSAARTIENTYQSLKEIYNSEGKKGLEKLPEIGSNIADHIVEYLETGKIEKFEKIKKDAPASTHELIQIDGLGPKRVKQLVEELNIKNISDLKKAIKKHRVKTLKGFGYKTEKNLQKSIEQYENRLQRMFVDKALNLAENTISYLIEKTDIDRINYAGSLRRMKETIGDIDILVTASSSKDIMDTFVNMPGIERVVSKGTTRSTVLLKEGINVDLRVILEDSYGSAMQYFTGSKDHNIELRNIALRKGYKLSEYGLYSKKSNKKEEGKSEKSIYAKLGLEYIPPELRENRGEFKAADTGHIPELVELNDIQGDLHTHTKFSEGKNNIENMAEAAQNRGYEYIAITDHSISQKIAGGMEIDELKQQWDIIDNISDNYKIKILKGAEVDILSDGSLDYPDDILKTLDIVIGSVHSGLKSSKSEMTERIITALNNKYLNILGHPTGRIIGKREGSQLDLEKIFETAVDNNKILEINGQPRRLDLNDELILKASEFDVKFCINTDSHDISQLDFMKYGIGQARRGWLVKDAVINSYSYSKLRKIL
jgi:DNA polymerase (family 10)